MSLPKFIDTTEWAKAQDRVFAGEDMPFAISRYYHLCLAQEQICPTNLTLRHRLINAGWDALNSETQTGSLSRALAQFHTLRKGDYWAEGYSYWEYTLRGLEWYSKRHGLPEDIVAVMERISASYEAIKPCPLPEVSDLGFPQDGPDYVSTPSYFCRRWRNPDGSLRAHLLIALNTDPEPRLNLHHHLEAGYFAFWKNSGVTIQDETDGDGRDWRRITPGTWLHRCKPYTSFDFKESLTSSALAACLPKGAMPPTWRAKPPRATVFQDVGRRFVPYYASGPGHIQLIEHPIFRFTWNNGLFCKQTRTIEVLPDKVVVMDGGLFRRDKVTEYGV